MRLIFKVAIGAVIVVFAAFGYTFWAITQENPSPITELNPQSSQVKAILIYDPGVSGFESGVANAFAGGLTNNWHVYVTTATSQTPTDLSGYGLVVLSSPIYGGQPSVPMQGYIGRLMTLQDVKVVSLLTGAGTGDEAKAWMADRIPALGGDEVLSIVLFSMAPNEQQYGSTDPFVIATNAAQSLS